MRSVVTFAIALLFLSQAVFAQHAKRVRPGVDAVSAILDGMDFSAGKLAKDDVARLAQRRSALKKVIAFVGELDATGDSRTPVGSLMLHESIRQIQVELFHLQILMPMLASTTKANQPLYMKWLKDLIDAQEALRPELSASRSDVEGMLRDLSDRVERCDSADENPR